MCTNEFDTCALNKSTSLSCNSAVQNRVAVWSNAFWLIVDALAAFGGGELVVLAEDHQQCAQLPDQKCCLAAVLTSMLQLQQIVVPLHCVKCWDAGVVLASAM